MRNGNHWNHRRPLPDTFYDGTTGIAPVDDTVHRIVEPGYCHHIERLMVLGDFMLLCRIDPDDVYRWFMEMFVDAYDWVMVPNAYAMSQHSDGGLSPPNPTSPAPTISAKCPTGPARKARTATPPTGPTPGTPSTDMDRQTRRRTGEEPALGHDGEREQADGGGEDDGVSGGGRGVVRKQIKDLTEFRKALLLDVSI